MKRAIGTIVTALFGVIGLVAFPGLASATVVPPGGSGKTCSGYSYVTGHPGWYWQTCAWADNNEVYFTVHLGNSSDYDWWVDTIWVDYIKSGVERTCAAGVWNNEIFVDDHSITQTPTATCAIPRQRAAYASIGQVWEGSYHAEVHSPTLQVQ